IKNYFRDPIQKGIPCSKSLTRICIDYQGRIYGGCWSLGYWGEIRSKNLHEIINSPPYLLAQRKMFYKDCPGCSCGYTTDLNYSIKYLFEEIKYRFLTKGT
ncbi:MAG: hypothetical protein NC928_02070, partial [Candidatus Omnitrophica bacterium]|nr:hypothetical protein [Candidatus Omnitrophota bacterium]